MNPTNNANVREIKIKAELYVAFIEDDNKK